MLYCKTWMLCNPSDMFAWAYSLLIQKKEKKGVQIINKKRKVIIIIIIIITLPIPEKAFGHNQLPIPNRKLENKI